MKHAAVCLVAVLVLSPGTLVADTHPFGVQDMIDMQRVSGPLPSPDGKLIAFGLSTYTLEANRGSADLWLVSPDGGEPRQLTTHEAQDFGADWSPDSRSLAFLSTRSGSSQVWRISVDGGEAVQVTDLPLDVDGVKWSPDGRRLAVVLAVYPHCDTLECTAERDQEKADSPVRARIIDSLLYRHWDHWEDYKRNHIFALELEGGKLVDLMDGMDADSPTVPWGGTEEFAWTADSAAVIFTAKTEENPERHTNYDLFSVQLAGGDPVKLTDNPAWDTTPALSPDGTQLAWMAMKRPGYESDRFRVMVRDMASGKARPLTEKWDRSVSSIAWTPNGAGLLVTANNEGKKAAFRIDATTGDATQLLEEGHNGSVSALPDGRLVFSRDSFTAPANIFVAAANGAEPQQLTHFNDARVAAARMSEPEEFWFKGAAGDRIHGWFLRPVDWKEGVSYPLAYLIHGGPQGSWTNHFHYRWNPQAYAGAGYAVAMVDFHGSTGYGQKFTDSINRDWGGKPFEDLMKGVDWLLKEHDWIDGDRLGASGASYGGYMVNWIAGHTDRFSCLVNHDGLFSTRSMYYSTEELWFPEWDLGGPAWESKEIYRKWDPSEFIGNWKTPMLVIHGQLDYRVVDTEGLSTFTALQRRGIESRLLYFPDEDHWITKPQNMKLWHETVLGWLDRFLK